jgi:hypothetical protein
VAGLTAAVVWASGCLSERSRPGPPALQIAFGKTAVHSPDTLTGQVQVSDPDGLDSVWLTVDSTRAAADAFLATSYAAPFSLKIRSGYTTGQHVPVRLEARDLSGFRSALDTFVVVAP